MFKRLFKVAIITKKIYEMGFEEFRAYCREHFPELTPQHVEKLYFTTRCLNKVK